MARNYGSPEMLINSLWKSGDAYLRTAVAHGVADVDVETELGKHQSVTTSDDRLRISRDDDALEIGATVEELRSEGRILVDYRFEWGPYMDDPPEIFKEEWQENKAKGVRTVPKRDFGRVATLVSGIIAEAQQALGQ